MLAHICLNELINKHLMSNVPLSSYSKMENINTLIINKIKHVPWFSTFLVYLTKKAIFKKPFYLLLVEYYCI